MDMDESKSNVSEEEIKKESAVEKTKDDLKNKAQGLFVSLKKFLGELLDFRDDTDRDATV